MDPNVRRESDKGWSGINDTDRPINWQGSSANPVSYFIFDIYE
jgi:hypothetical protein